MTAKELRKKYLDFFKKKGHAIIPSASLIPSETTELTGTQKVLFTTAGMHPLVPYLLGESHPAGKRLANVQKSMRTDDIDDVGDAWHNTFFEMLGNWSLGDYWKREAIEWSFEFLTKELRLGPKRIYVTVFGSDPEIPGVGEDEETIGIWKDLGIAENRIFRLGKKDNWWGPVGQTGPCGPDTEMFYDTGRANHGEKCQPGETCGKYAEIWNDVFMEFNRTADGKYEPLKQKNVDTGMGVERTVAILQGKDNVYDTELFREAMERIENKATNFNLTKARKIADHLRTATFLIADGVNVLGRDDRGSVLNTMLTNTFSYLKTIGAKGSIASYVAKAFVAVYEADYKNLREKKEFILSEISRLETRYREEAIVKDKREKTALLPIKSISTEERKRLIEAKCEKILGRKISFSELNKTYNSLGTVSATLGTVSADFKQNQGVPFEDSLRVAEEVYPKLNPDEFKTNFWSAMNLHSERSKAVGQKKFAGGLASHSEVSVRGHTATHLLHQALRDVLGDHVCQTGSNITPERIRFDFSHGEKLTPEQIKKVEETVNSKIKEDLPVIKKLMSQEEADKTGAIGLFREKYGDEVSIYKIGDYSVEYCGGPHVERTSKVGKFKIIKEEALGVGQRRIRATID
jgi:alanyl-tRNA synthetase